MKIFDLTLKGNTRYENSIEIEKKDTGLYEITVYDYYNDGCIYDIEKDKLKELRDKISEMLESEEE